MRTVERDGERGGKREKVSCRRVRGEEKMLGNVFTEIAGVFLIVWN